MEFSLKIVKLLNEKTNVIIDKYYTIQICRKNRYIAIPKFKLNGNNSNILTFMKN